MPAIDFATIAKDMINAAKGQLTDHWKEAKPYAEKEIKAFVDNLKLIAKLKAEKKITIEQAKLHISLQKNSMRIVLLTIKGLGLLAVESAINAALDTVRVAVNKAIGWNIL